MKRTVEFVKELELPFHLRMRKGVIRLQVFGQKRVKQWINLILPLLVGKHEQAKIVREFIALREKVIDKHPFHKPYSLEEVALWDRIHNINANRNVANPQRLYARALLEKERARYSLNSSES